mgnify:CR=1 FL=1
MHSALRGCFHVQTALRGRRCLRRLHNRTTLRAATNGCSLPEARPALRQVIGAYAIPVVEKGNPDRIVAARQSTPMVGGGGDGGRDAAYRRERQMCRRDGQPRRRAQRQPGTNDEKFYA